MCGGVDSGLLEVRESAARERVEDLREAAARAAAALEAAEIELDRRVIAREGLVEALAASAAGTTALTEAETEAESVPASVPLPAGGNRSWHAQANRPEVHQGRDGVVRPRLRPLDRRRIPRPRTPHPAPSAACRPVESKYIGGLYGKNEPELREEHFAGHWRTGYGRLAVVYPRHHGFFGRQLLESLRALPDRPRDGDVVRPTD